MHISLVLRDHSLLSGFPDNTKATIVSVKEYDWAKLWENNVFVFSFPIKESGMDMELSKFCINWQGI